MEPISVQVQDILQNLGESSEAVAAALKSKDIRGVRNTVRFLNPIVRLIEKSIQASHVSIDLMEPNMLRITLQDGGTVEVGLPPAVREFLVAFDHGVYPDLEAE